MKIEQKQVLVRELCKNYSDDGEGGVFGYNNRLTIRPAYQREFIYDAKQRAEVMRSVIKGFPLNVMYWSKSGDDLYEMLDGQQRSISIAQYVNNDFSLEGRFFHNLTDDEKEAIYNYPLFVFVCDGTAAEKIEWFKVINIAGERLLPQELLNAVYTGPWLSDARRYFSKTNCVAYQKAKDYFTAKLLRQELLAKVLGWIADRDGLPDGQEYMAVHQHDKDANELWLYFCEVMDWAMRLFPLGGVQQKLVKSQEWGLLYNQYKGRSYNTNELGEEIHRLMLDDDVTKKQGIIPYVLSDKTPTDEKHLSIRAFTESQKMQAYEKQKGICKHCGLHFSYENMQGDHVIPWSQGGHTTIDNLQMLCRNCNGSKSDN